MSKTIVGITAEQELFDHLKYLVGENEARQMIEEYKEEVLTDYIKSYFNVLITRMKDRDDDSAEPKNAIDKGYSLAVSHMNMEIDMILSDLRK